VGPYQRDSIAFQNEGSGLSFATMPAKDAIKQRRLQKAANS
jgi:hypothetical protein